MSRNSSSDEFTQYKNPPLGRVLLNREELGFLDLALNAFGFQKNGYSKSRLDTGFSEIKNGRSEIATELLHQRHYIKSEKKGKGSRNTPLFNP
jgi:hypothetical protein